MRQASIGMATGLAVLALANSSEAADLTSAYPPAVVAAPVIGGAPLAGTPIMVSPIRSRSFKPIQTHIIAQPAPNPRAVREGPVFGPAYPVIIVVKP